MEFTRSRLPEDPNRMFRAPELVQERLVRATRALHDAELDYAIIGANAVAYWVGVKDEGSIRNTPNIDILVRRTDAEHIRASLEAVGFVAAPSEHSPVLFLDGPQGKPRQAVQMWFVGDTIG